MNEDGKTYEERQLKLLKIQTGILAVILAVVLVAGTFVAVQVGSAAKMVQEMGLGKVSQIITDLEEVTAQLNDVDMTAIGSAVDALKDAAGTLSQADVSAINDGIRALSGAADNLKDLDIDKFNDLIESLQTVTSQMQSTTSVLSKIFGK